MGNTNECALKIKESGGFETWSCRCDNWEVNIKLDNPSEVLIDQRHRALSSFKRHL